jgi:hypothetical protein
MASSTLFLSVSCVVVAVPSPPPDPVGGEAAAARFPGGTVGETVAVGRHPPLRRIQWEGSRLRFCGTFSFDLVAWQFLVIFVYICFSFSFLLLFV